MFIEQVKQDFELFCELYKDSHDCDERGEKVDHSLVDGFKGIILESSFGSYSSVDRESEEDRPIL